MNKVDPPHLSFSMILCKLTVGEDLINALNEVIPTWGAMDLFYSMVLPMDRYIEILTNLGLDKS